MNVKEAYDEILSVLNKHKDICIYNLDDFEFKAKCHILGIELKEKYGLDIDPTSIGSLSFIRINDYVDIAWYGGKYSRTISWPDDDRQPEDELLCAIGFSTGAYIFGEDYPEELFKEFWHELRSYKPKYIDTVNKNMFFPIEEAAKVFNEFPSILRKYRQKYADDSKLRKIKKLQKELEELNKGDT